MVYLLVLMNTKLILYAYDSATCIFYAYTNPCIINKNWTVFLKNVLHGWSITGCHSIQAKQYPFLNPQEHLIYD